MPAFIAFAVISAGLRLELVLSVTRYNALFFVKRFFKGKIMSNIKIVKSGYGIDLSPGL